VVILLFCFFVFCFFFFFSQVHKKTLNCNIFLSREQKQLKDLL
jgi:hypothetical protein